MNKHDVAIVALLIAALLGWLFYQNQIHTETRRTTQAPRTESAEAPAISGQAQESAAWTPPPEAATGEAQSPMPAPVSTPEPPEEPEARAPEQVLRLHSDEMDLTVSSWGGVLQDATLLEYPSAPNSETPVRLDFGEQPALALRGLPGLHPRGDFSVVSSSSTEALLQRQSASGLVQERHIRLAPDYRLQVRDRLINHSERALTLATNSVSLGAIQRGTSKNDTLAMDSLALEPDTRGKAPKVRHWEKHMNGLFTGGSGRGCAGAPPADNLPLVANTRVEQPQAWLALKSRFFVQVFSSDITNRGFRVNLARVNAPGRLQLDHVSAQVHFDGAELAPGASLVRNYSLYIGPKKLSLLKHLGHRTAEIMQFGTFRWMCVLLVPTLNFFHRLIPNYGVAVILLTLLVRIVFWPLTHKSTESMKRMQALQPKLKEIQAKFKDNPQKLQQETWQIYRENKVNPLSSCLPMLIQIPVFIALFTVLRSAVELRYASFLWIQDLSEPENLLAGVLPVVPALNILPFVMAGTMLLQSRMTPSMGDPTQQKMMMWMMPAMMLFMFYSMPSALVLYWTVSQMLSIAQLYWQRRRQAVRTDGPPDDAGDATQQESLTRQMRRRMTR